MRILLISPNWHGGTHDYCRSAFEELGHDVEVFYCTDTMPNTIERIRRKLFKLSAVTRRLDGLIRSFFANRALLKIVSDFKPHFIFAINGDSILPETWVRIKKKNIPVIFWFIDSPFITHNRSVLKNGPFADHLFLFDPYYADELRIHGFKDIEYMPFACDPGMHRKIELSAEDMLKYGSDVSFVGVNFDVREKILRELLDFDIKIWGIGWKNVKEPLKSRVTEKKVPLEEAVKIHNASKIVLNINAPQSVNSTNTRTFEASGCGAFQLTEAKPEMKNLYAIGEEAVCYKDINDLKKTIRYYLDHPEEREKIARNGQKRTYRDHTYRQRMARVVDVALSLMNGKNQPEVALCRQ